MLFSCFVVFFLVNLLPKIQQKCIKLQNKNMETDKFWHGLIGIDNVGTVRNLASCVSFWRAACCLHYKVKQPKKLHRINTKRNKKETEKQSSFNVSMYCSQL